MSERITEAQIKALIKAGKPVYLSIRGPIDCVSGRLLALPVTFCSTAIYLTPVVSHCGTDFICGFGTLQVPVANCVWHAPGSENGFVRGELQVLENAICEEGGK